jgi:BirA family biotin operon repressor/biotin-[acetyl-CoA-carboxylase] ligase
LEVLEKLYYAPRIESTQTQLIQFFQKGIATNQYGIYSFNQTKGKGQGNHSWDMGPEDGLAISLGFKISSKHETFDWVTINKHITTLICTYLQRHCEEPLFIKWPNDLLCQDKKLSGILMQVLPFQEAPEIISNKINSENHDKLFILGIGININPTETENSENTEKRISLNQINQFKIEDLHQFAHSLAEFLFERALNIPRETEKIHLYFEQCLWRFSELVNVQISIPNPKIHEAIFKGVDQNGRAILEIDGEILAFQHGDARILY